MPANTASASASPSPSPASTPAAPKPSVSAADFSESDPALRSDDAFKRQQAAYDRPAAADAVERTVRALTGFKYDVRVVDDEQAAVAALDELLKPGMTYSSGGSTTLSQIGWPERLAARTDIVNFKGQAIAAAAAGDRAKQQQLLAAGASADMFVSSVSAVTEEGALHAADLSGTRISGWIMAKHLVVVTGTNKIVRSDAEADDRLIYQWKLESARARVAFNVGADGRTVARRRTDAPRASRRSPRPRSATRSRSGRRTHSRRTASPSSWCARRLGSERRGSR